jgi:hypothetical protein
MGFETPDHDTMARYRDEAEGEWRFSALTVVNHSNSLQHPRLLTPLLESNS